MTDAGRVRGDSESSRGTEPRCRTGPVALLLRAVPVLLAAQSFASPVLAGTTVRAEAVFSMQMYGGQIMEDLDAAACKILGGGGCFTAGTLVQTETGPKPIEQVRAGDLVWAYNAASGHWEFDPVDASYSKPYEGELVSITVGGNTVQMTADHPVFVISGNDLDSRHEAVDTADGEPGTATGGRWISARDLRPGDVLRAESDGTAVIDAVSSTIEQTTVYSLTVENAHTFAVGSEGVLVHNACTDFQFNLIQQKWQTWFPIQQIQNADGTVTFVAGDTTLINAGSAFANGGSLTAKLKSGVEETVNFKKTGFPDLSPFLWDEANGGLNTVEIKYSASRDTDRKWASIKAGFVRADGSWYVPKGYVWHHTEDLKMQLVREDVHNAVKHTGGFAIFKAGMRKILQGQGKPIPKMYQ